MTLKTAALLAFVGMLLLTVLVAADFIKTVTGIMHDVVPAMALLRSLVYVLASLSVTVFFLRFPEISIMKHFENPTTQDSSWPS